MKLEPRDVEEIHLMLEDLLRRSCKVTKIEKMKMRSMVRKEIRHLFVWKGPTADRIFSRWELKLTGVFSISPFWFKDNLRKILTEKLNKTRVRYKKG